jgi:hypothetical protein
MENRRWLRWDRLMRVSHLYTGLFLMPWMLVYAVSAFCLNHSGWFTETLHLAPTWKVVRETSFVADARFPAAPTDQAEVILKHLALQGPLVIMDSPAAGPLTFIRLCAAGHYRITWHRPQSRLVVERQQPASFYSLVNSLHFQHGYRQPYFAHIAWAVILDAVAISTAVWVVSGVWLWARKPRKDPLGWLCMGVGSLLFAGLTVLLCR